LQHTALLYAKLCQKDISNQQITADEAAEAKHEGHGQAVAVPTAAQAVDSLCCVSLQESCSPHLKC
jgi:hypothetical protein